MVLIITNYRIIFDPATTPPCIEFAKFLQKQPEYIRSFFDLRVAQIAKIELEQDMIYIYTRFDGRVFRIQDPKGAQSAKGIVKLIEANCFFDKTYESLKNSFAFQNGPDDFHGRSVVDQFKRMCNDLLQDEETPEGRFTLLENTNYQICPTYPAVILEPKSISQA